MIHSADFGCKKCLLIIDSSLILSQRNFFTQNRLLKCLKTENQEAITQFQHHTLMTYYYFPFLR